MKSLFTIIIVVALGVFTWTNYSYLKSEAAKSKDALSAIPTDAFLIIQTPQLQTAWSKLSETNLVYASLLNDSEFAKYHKHIAYFDSIIQLHDGTKKWIDHRNVTIGLIKDTETEFLISLNCSDNEFYDLNEALAGDTKSSAKMKTVIVDSSQYYFSYSSPFFIFSSSEKRLNESLAQIKTDNTLLNDSVLTKLLDTKAHESLITLAINQPKFLQNYSHLFQKTAWETWYTESKNHEWLCADLRLKSNALVLNGLYLDNLTPKNQETSISRFKAAPLLPKDIQFLNRKAILNPTNFVNTQSLLSSEDADVACNCNAFQTFASLLGDELIEFHFNHNKNHAVAFNTFDVYNKSGALSNFGVIDSAVTNFKEFNLYSVDSDLIFNLLGEHEFRDAVSDIYFTEIGEYAVFSSEDGLLDILRQYWTKKNIIPETSFTDYASYMMASYSDEDLYYTYNQALVSLKTKLKEEYHNRMDAFLSVTEDLEGVSMQYAHTKKSFKYFNLAINTKQGGVKNDLINEMWKLQFKNPILYGPVLMKNHKTNTKEVLLQDNQNVLHLVSATGKVKWSKAINEPIIGNVNQIDIYQNNKYQMLITTASKIHLIDINGNYVNNFPIKGVASFTAEAAAIDYEKNGNYRFIVPDTDKKLRNYDKSGKVVEGWSFNQSKGLMVRPVEHFVINNKDYVFNYDIAGNVYLLNRKGEIRHNVDSTFITHHKESSKFIRSYTLDHSKILYLDTLNQFNSLTLNGAKVKLDLADLPSSFNFQIADIDDDQLPEYYIIEPNKITIYGPDRLAIYSEIFNEDITNAVRISEDYHRLLIQQGDKVLLYDKNFKPLNLDGIEGSIHSDFGDLNRDGHQDIVTLSSKQTLIMYSINPFYHNAEI